MLPPAHAHEHMNAWKKRDMVMCRQLVSLHKQFLLFVIRLKNFYSEHWQNILLFIQHPSIQSCDAHMFACHVILPQPPLAVLPITLPHSGAFTVEASWISDCVAVYLKCFTCLLLFYFALGFCRFFFFSAGFPFPHTCQIAGILQYWETQVIFHDIKCIIILFLGEVF
jgi:hypothetical protein